MNPRHTGTIVTEALWDGVEVGTLLIDSPSWQIRLIAKRNEHFVQIPCGVELRTRILDAMREAPAEFVARAPDRVIPL